MTYYSIEQGDRGQVFDATGTEIEGVIACDTETGETVRHKRTEDGEFVLDASRQEIERETVRFPAPLRFVRSPTDSEE